MSTSIKIHKKSRKLELYNNDIVIKSYRVALGFTPYGAKEIEGDGKTPEGEYQIDYKNDKSKFCLSMHISYPNKEQIEHALTNGVNAGGDIMIHGIKNKYAFLPDILQKHHYLRNWTKGCIALTNKQIKELWGLTPIGTKVYIYP